MEITGKKFGAYNIIAFHSLGFLSSRIYLISFVIHKYASSRGIN